MNRAGWGVFFSGSAIVLIKGNNLAYLVVKTVCDVPTLEGEHQPHGIGHVCNTTTTRSLFAKHADVDEDPQNQARPEFIEGLDVE